MNSLSSPLDNNSTCQQESRHVFIRDAHFSWIPATIISTQSSDVMVSLSPGSARWNETTVKSDRRQSGMKKISLSDYHDRKLPLRNVEVKADLHDLTWLNEAAILYNVKDLFTKDVIYIRIGEILVALNPFKWMDGLYSKDKQVIYAERILKGIATNEAMSYDSTRLEPHIYETSSLAYKGLVNTHQNQTIVVTGESGAGKTETVKILMSHLAQLPHFNPRMRIVERIQESNPVFEAFGNAKTGRNNNSSRFGKFILLQYAYDEGDNLILEGSNCETYLLEKSRIVGQSAGERNYHIFYQLLSAPDYHKASFLDGFSCSNVSSFQCLGGSIESKDVDSWMLTVNALKLFGICGDDMKHLVQALYVVLLLGNLKFGCDPANDKATIISTNDLESLCHFLELSANEIIESLTKQKIKTKWDDIDLTLSPEAAKDGCDALAKSIYERLFDYLVRKINQTTRNTDSNDHDNAFIEKKTKFIGLLDIFGFEAFEMNSVEQLYINYANERFQQKYVQDVFKSIKEEYEPEGLQMFDLKGVDNSLVVNLFESKIGILSMLNEESIRPKGNDSSFVYKVKSKFSHADYLIKDKLQSPLEFGVHHFAGPVTYNATKFVERNIDLLPESLIECLSSSTNRIISSQFASLSTIQLKRGKWRRRSYSTVTTVASKFKTQLDNLMVRLQKTKTRYVRCIKPNSFHKPGVMDHKLTLHQLKSAGLMTAALISRGTFTKKLPHRVVIKRFQHLVEQCLGDDEISKANNIVSKLLKDDYKDDSRSSLPAFACGRCNIFFRSGSLERLESLRVLMLNEKVTLLQNWGRSMIARWKYEAVLKSIMVLQTFIRGNMMRRCYEKVLSSTILVQNFFRMAFTRRGYQHQRRIIINLQSCWRRQLLRCIYFVKLKAVTVVQCWMRSTVVKKKYEDTRRVIISFQSHCRCYLSRGRYEKEIKSVCIIQRWIRQKYMQRDVRAAFILQNSFRIYRQRKTATRFHNVVKAIHRTVNSKKLSRTEPQKMIKKVHKLQKDLVNADTSGMNQGQKKVFYESAELLERMENEMSALKHKLSTIEDNLAHERSITKKYKSQVQYFRATMAHMEKYDDELREANKKMLEEAKETRNQNACFKKVIKYMYKKRVKKASKYNENSKKETNNSETKRIEGNKLLDVEGEIEMPQSIESMTGDDMDRVFGSFQQYLTKSLYPERSFGGEI